MLLAHVQLGGHQDPWGLFGKAALQPVSCSVSLLWKHMAQRRGRQRWRQAAALSQWKGLLVEGCDMHALHSHSGGDRL